MEAAATGSSERPAATRWPARTRCRSMHPKQHAFGMFVNWNISCCRSGGTAKQLGQTQGGLVVAGNGTGRQGHALEGAGCMQRGA